MPDKLNLSIYRSFLELYEVLFFIENFDMNKIKKKNIKKCFMQFHLEILKREIVYILLKEDTTLKTKQFLKKILKIIKLIQINLKK